jgi:CBS domain containing-hemolysin-like protein
MDPDPATGSRLWLWILITAILFILSALFALMETAFASVSRTRIKVLEEKDPRAKRVLYVLDHFDQAVTTLLIVINIAHLSAASIVTLLVTRAYNGTDALAAAVTVSTFATTIAMFFVAELLPKSIGKKTAEASSLAFSGFLRFLMIILWPFSKLLALIGSGVKKGLKDDEEATVTEDELYDIIEDMQEEGAIDEEQGELVSSALQFGDVTVSSILTPRVDLAAFDVNDSPEEIYELLKSSNHSRIVAYEKTVDNVIGVLQIRKYFKKYLKTGRIPEVRPLLDKVYFAHQSMEIDELLTEMSRRKLNMAVITDSYGGTLGVVTVEDILEEIVGEIWDEDDEIKEPLVRLTDDTFLVSGDETVLDAFDFIGFEDPEEKENEDRYTNLRVSDWVFEQFSRIPARGASFRYYDLDVKVTDIRHNRIFKVRMTLLPKEEKEEEKSGEGAERRQK